MLNVKLSAIFILASIVLLSGCGGGGGSSGPSGPVTSTDSFPLAQAVAAKTAAGENRNFSATATGTASCSGSGNITEAPGTTATSFFYITPTDTVSALSAVRTITLNWTNCTPASSVATETIYYNPSNYLPLGFNSTGVNYGAYLTAPTIPATVTVGATGIIGTENLYTDSTEITSNGHIDGSYVVTADTASTAIITEIGKIYDASSTLTATEQDAWRITATGVLTRVTTNIQYTSGANVTFTYN
jgi:hypothetical protein